MLLGERFASEILDFTGNQSITALKPLLALEFISEQRVWFQDGFQMSESTFCSRGEKKKSEENEVNSHYVKCSLSPNGHFNVQRDTPSSMETPPTRRTIMVHGEMIEVE